MKIAVLTSSRADYSIYLPLLKKLKDDPFFEMSIIAFGTHLSRYHGYTVQNILQDGFEVLYRIESLVDGETPAAISSSVGLTVLNFSTLWSSKNFDTIVALGDRYEMFAAVLSSLPFNLKITHIHGGETTLGAIDNVFRHSISLMSSLHFVSTEFYRTRLVQLLGSSDNVYNVGALSIENISHLNLLSIGEFESKYGINLEKKTILCTFHPETILYEENKRHVRELISLIDQLEGYQILITMPNADTMGSYIRNEITVYSKTKRNVFIVESLGTVDYLSAMKHCSFLLGNSSSGFVEASYFQKKVVNIGMRQFGRVVTANIYNCAIKCEEILKTIKRAEKEPDPDKVTLYGNGTTSDQIIQHLKRFLNL